MLTPRASPARLPGASGSLGPRGLASVHFRDVPPRRNFAVRGAETPDKGTAPDVARALQDAEALLADVGTGRAPQKAESSESGDKPRLVLHCDVNGCTIAPVVTDRPQARHPEGTVMGTLHEAEETAPKDLVVMEGEGWKLGYDRGATEEEAYSAFVGGPGWTLCLAREEFVDFIKLLKNLQRSVATLNVCGSWHSDSEESTLEMRSRRVWIQGRAPNKRLSVLQRLWSRKPAAEVPDKLPDVAFALRFIVTTEGSREVEGSFPPEAVMEILRAIGGESGEGEAVEGFAFAEAQEALRRVGWKSVLDVGPPWRGSLETGICCLWGLHGSRRQHLALWSSYKGSSDLKMEEDTSRQEDWSRFALQLQNSKDKSANTRDKIGERRPKRRADRYPLRLQPKPKARRRDHDSENVHMAVSEGMEVMGGHAWAKQLKDPMDPPSRIDPRRHKSRRHGPEGGAGEMLFEDQELEELVDELSLDMRNSSAGEALYSHNKRSHGTQRDREQKSSYFNPPGLSYHLWQKQQRIHPFPSAPILKDIRVKNIDNQRLVNYDILPCVADRDVLESAFLTMYTRHGSFQAAQEQLEVFAKDWLPHVSEKLLQESYTFPALIQLEPRQTHKGGGARLVPLWWHKTVPEAMRMVLEAVFESGFPQCVHGFRPGRSCHSALKQVKDDFGDVKYFLEVDLTGSLGNFDMTVLLQAVGERVGDERFLKLLDCAHRAGIAKLKGVNYGSIGMPQVSIISPILCNIYLQRLDKWMEDLMRVLDVGRINPGSDDSYSAVITRERWVSELVRFAECWHEQSLISIHYVRYGANFLIGVNGSKRDCQLLEHDLRKFLKSELRLEPKNSSFVMAPASTPDKESVSFLGAEIYVAQQISPPGSDPGSREAGKLPLLPRVCIPARYLLARLEEHGFTHKTKKKPTYCGRVVNWEVHEIVKFYDVTARMFMSYYTFADNYHCLSLLFDILRQSCALSLGKKLGLKKIGLVTKRFGRDLVVRGDSDEVLAAMYRPKFDRPRVPFTGRDLNPFSRLERPTKPKFPHLEERKKHDGNG
eukprot:evm.model.scf_116.7 EVM.evm.TU.scf_116.7   scf_116:65647-71826(+)